MDVHDLDLASSSNVSKDRLVESLLRLPDLFFRSQQRGEAEIRGEEKRTILKELLDQKPSVFLQRYHPHIEKEFIDCFPLNERCDPFIRLIRDRPARQADRDYAVRNRRFMAMQKLKLDGSYFSLEKMRERAPMDFDLMVGSHLLDSEKIQLRPTVEARDGGEFSNLMEQFDESQRISDRRKRHLESHENFRKSDSTDRFMSHVTRRTKLDDDEFEMEFDSDDDEGRAAEAKRQRMLNRYTVDKEVPAQNSLPEMTDPNETVEDETTRQMSELSVVEAEPNEVSQAVDIPHEALMSEFQSFMETRFLTGEDDQFVDYAKIDEEDSEEVAKWKIRDEEDAYFADVDDE